MSMEILGVEMTPDVRQWRQPQRRVGSLLVMASAAALVVVGLVTWLLAKDAAAAFYWVLVVLLVLVLAAMAAILLVGSPGARAAHGATPKHETPHYGPSGPKPAPEPAAGKPASADAAKPAAAKPTLQTLTLRCGDCGTVFDVDDTGDRPLYHACPGCGAEGALRDAPVPPAPAPKAAASTGSAPAQAPASGVKRLKLRCGGCKEVFSIDDSGERPLRRPCPHCGRVGEIR